jgi:hypothetical protein
MKLSNYWYWRDPTLRARSYEEDSVVVVKNKKFNTMSIFSNEGRHGVFNACVGEKKRNVHGIDGKPFVHHYSWVRTKEEMLKKVKSWGHRNDASNWIELVEKEFEGPFTGTDFLKGLSYDVVEDIYHINQQR